MVSFPPGSPRKGTYGPVLCAYKYGWNPGPGRFLKQLLLSKD